MNIVLFPNPLKPDASKLAAKIAKTLSDRGVNVYSEDEQADNINAKPLSSIPHDQIDCMISLGGDGTILRLIHMHPEIKAPILPINFGGLGFMADITENEIDASLDSLLKGEYEIQNRIMMEGRSTGNPTSFAVNDIVFHRAHTPNLIDLRVTIDGVYLNTFSADGIIIATPTGSTAYSLASGGPILTPEVTAFVLTPICPHTLSNRPIVLMPRVSIEIQYLSRVGEIEVIADGFTSVSISTGEIYEIKLSRNYFQLIVFPPHNYYQTLRSKLGWAGTSRLGENKP